MRLRRLCLEIFALRRFFSEPMVAFSITDRAVGMEAFSGRDCKLTSLLEVCHDARSTCALGGFCALTIQKNDEDSAGGLGPPIGLVPKKDRAGGI
jgi:hypothetical protein